MNADTKNHIVEAIELHKEMVAAIQEDSVEVIAAIAEAITTALEQDGTIYLCGNGGSAADAQRWLVRSAYVPDAVYAVDLGAPRPTRVRPRSRRWMEFS